MAYISDRTDGTVTAGMGETTKRQTLEDSLKKLAGEIVRTREILGINLPENSAEKEPLAFGKVELLTRLVELLYGDVRRTNETLNGL